MTVPRWAPQNQQQTVAGRDATSVGGDQHIQNIYHAKAQGLNISYKDFVDAIKTERLEERRLVENHFLSELRDAYADFTTLQAERDRLLLERRSLPLRSSWLFVAIVAALALSVGAVLGVGFASIGQPKTTTDPSSTVTVTATATVTPIASYEPTALNSGTDLDLTSRPCESSDYTVQLAALANNGDPTLRDQRAQVLLEDLTYRLEFTKRDESAFISRGTDYCYSSDSEYADYLFIWVGPLSSTDADRLCKRYRTTGVSADCIVSKPAH